MQSGHMDREALRLLLAQGDSVERIAVRFRRHPSTVAYWIAQHGLVANGRQKHGARGGLDRDLLEALVARGMSITEIAAEVDRSKGTVRHWLKRYGLTTLNAGRRAERRRVLEAAAAAGEEPRRDLTMVCRLHGETGFVREGSGYYRCRRCRSDSVSQHRRRLKDVIVAEAGGCCAMCGYDRESRALEFHHIDRSTKSFALSQKGVTRSLVALRAEAQKCVLLCANCHAEIESGSVALVDRVSGLSGSTRSPGPTDPG